MRAEEEVIWWGQGRVEWESDKKKKPPVETTDCDYRLIVIITHILSL